MEDLTKILGQMREAQARVQDIQKKMTLIKATGEAGAGAVKVTMDGHKKVLKLDIEEEFIRPEEKETLQDLIIAAITLATQAVTEKVKEEIEQSTVDLGWKIPIDFML